MRPTLYACAALLAAGFAPFAFQGAAYAAPAPDKNGIIWDDPAPAASADRISPVKTAPPPAAAPTGTLDNAGIIWNAPANAGGKPGAPTSSAGIPATPRPRTMAAAPSTSGACHEFQTTIVIDGQKQPAHGTVCQQADGTWRVVDK